MKHARPPSLPEPEPLELELLPEPELELAPDPEPELLLDPDPDAEPELLPEPEPELLLVPEPELLFEPSPELEPLESVEPASFGILAAVVPPHAPSTPSDRTKPDPLNRMLQCTPIDRRPSQASSHREDGDHARQLAVSHVAARSRDRQRRLSPVEAHTDDPERPMSYIELRTEDWQRPLSYLEPRRHHGQRPLSHRRLCTSPNDARRMTRERTNDRWVRRDVPCVVHYARGERPDKTMVAHSDRLQLLHVTSAPSPLR